MALSTHSFDLSIREEMERLAEHYTGIVERMVAGEMVFDAPWTDRRFQEIVNRQLAQISRLRKAAEDLDTISRIFGGKR